MRDFSLFTVFPVRHKTLIGHYMMSVGDARIDVWKDAGAFDGLEHGGNALEAGSSTFGFRIEEMAVM